MSNSIAIAALLAASLPVRADPPDRADGNIVTDEASAEVLGKPIPVGQRIDLPEGWMRVEEEGAEDREVGSFSVVPSASFEPTARALGGAPVEAGPAAIGEAALPPERQAATRPCRAERGAYLRELWRLSGIEVDSPEALLEGLEGDATGARTGFYWFALATDPFRPLAWSSDLRDRARALERCVREAQGR